MGLSIDNLNLELRVLLEVVGLKLEGRESRNRKDEWLQKVTQCDFALLIRLANHHGLIPWLAFNVGDEPYVSAKLADVELDQLNKLNKILRFNSEYQTRTAVSISELFNKNNLPHVVFKGSALLHQIYPDFLLSRASDDLDLLVVPESLTEAVSILESTGYQLLGSEEVAPQTLTQFIAAHEKWYRFRDISLKRSKRMPHQIDLHWRIADDFSFTVETKELLDDWTVVNTKYGELRSLPMHRHFVYVCSHGYSDYYFRLRYLVDVYLAMQHSEFNKQRVLEFAEACGVVRQVEQSMRLADCFFDVTYGGDQINSYTEFVIQRLLDSNGFSLRIHPNRGGWTRVDKNNHLMRQIRNRSTKSYWFSPILARTKLVASDLTDWKDKRTSVLWFYSSRLLNKLFIKNKQ